MSTVTNESHSSTVLIFPLVLPNERRNSHELTLNFVYDIMQTTGTAITRSVRTATDVQTKKSSSLPHVFLRRKVKFINPISSNILANIVL